MKIVVTGGGSGGHITPILAVAHELKKLDRQSKVLYIGQRGDSLADIPRQDPNLDEFYSVRAGKLRRYHGEGLRQLLDIKTMLLNVRDAVWVVIGLWQSFWLLKKLRPDVIFIKGGFVGVPVGLSAAVLKIPYITHDSDALPGLANRLIARWASLHAVALPKEIYAYPADKTVTVGVPIGHQYQPVTQKLQQSYREELGLAVYKQMIFVTGGGLGAQRINLAMVENAPELLKRYPELFIVHVAGRANVREIKAAYQALPPELSGRIQVKDYVTDLYRYSGAADLVIARAGATNLAELAAQHKACIIVPNPVLTGGHQLKNAKAFVDAKAVVQLTEDQLEQEGRLAHTVSGLLDNPEQRKELGRQLSGFAHPDAAHQLAMLLLGSK